MDRKEQTGILSPDEMWIYPTASLIRPYPDMNALIRHISPEEFSLLFSVSRRPPEQVSCALPREKVRLLAPIPRPAQDIICLGINYMAHAEEAARYRSDAFGGERSYPIYFSKRVNRAVADGEPILSHQDLVDSLDYEAELAVIIGKDAYHVPEKDAASYIFGYTVINDVSARNVQTPMGPCILSADSVPFPPVLKIQSRVNKELRQDSRTDLLIFDIAYVIHELSQGMTLRAGTIISMGTPAGVGMGFDPPRFLKPGEVVECRVEGIGIITNPVQ